MRQAELLNLFSISRTLVPRKAYPFYPLLVFSPLPYPFLLTFFVVHQVFQDTVGLLARLRLLYLSGLGPIFGAMVLSVFIQFSLMGSYMIVQYINSWALSSY